MRTTHNARLTRPNVRKAGHALRRDRQNADLEFAPVRRVVVTPAKRRAAASDVGLGPAQGARA